MSPVCTPPSPVSTWQDTPLHRLMLTALINQFENRLLSSNSATLTIEQWLLDNGLRASLPLRAERYETPPRPCPAPYLAALGLDGSNANPPAQMQPDPGDGHQGYSPASTLRHRTIRLAADGRVFSQAENWYRPDLLSEVMRHQLDTTDIPFGHIVRPLAFSRQLLLREGLWSPLPDGWQHGAFPPETGQALDLPPYLFRHVAVLRTGGGVPFSVVVETYTPETMRFAPPVLPACAMR
ncbi:hypothetical protein K2X14_15880 [Acetobacter sp. TBRC 12305]|uniref:Uncharacterized protein n=1 Tax=Acetobacter garciniae TaxID=2817435 RepID=A0A939HLG7_9PROT|nr:hypothetical protein [Acetobacter garciniae]MBO1326615.1 hypothetical protein [Acetobacter garciniae]MBX0346315.1 hypothetical protein [Acetobacter garciniae]